MTKQEAHKVLNEVREGIIYPQSVIVKALVQTGDINVHLVSNMHPSNSFDSSPIAVAAVLESQDGE